MLPANRAHLLPGGIAPVFILVFRFATAGAELGGFSALLEALPAIFTFCSPHRFLLCFDCSLSQVTTPVKHYFSVDFTFLLWQDAPMKFSTYLKNVRVTPCRFALLHGFSISTVWRASKGRTLRPAQAAKLSKATGGVVSCMDLLFPKK
jgi:hypothetical protein